MHYHGCSSVNHQSSDGCDCPQVLVIVIVAFATSPRASALDNGLGLSGPAMGWSSWNHFGGNGSHGNGRLGAQILKEICDAMVSSGLRDAGYR